MLLLMLYYLADVIAFFNVVVVGKTLHHMYGLIMADVIAFFNVVVVGETLHHMYGLIMADVIVRWQML